MLFTSLFSLLLLVVAGVLFDALRRDRRATSTDGPPRSTRRRSTRRAVANTSIGLVGALVAAWPLVPREPLWVVAYAATLALLALLILSLGVAEAIALKRQSQSESQRLIEELNKGP